MDLERIKDFKMLLRILFIALFWPSVCSAALLSDSQIVDWSNVGVRGGIPTYSGTTRDATDAPYNAAGDGTTDDTSAIQSAINASAAGDIVYLPTGTYRITSALEDYLGRGILINGDGELLTEIKIDHTGSGIIITNGSGEGTPLSITDNPISKGATTLTLSATTGLSIGDYIVISQTNETGVDCCYYSDTCAPLDCTWCGFDQNEDRAQTQINSVTNIAGNVITLEHPLYWTMNTSNSPQVTEITNLVDGFGIEDLTIKRYQTSSSSGVGEIVFSGAVDCWVQNVRLINASKQANIWTRRMYHSTFFKLYIDDTDTGYSHGSDSSYGILFYNENSENLIESNVFLQPRHAVVHEGGGSGNVIAYNYSQDPWDGSVCGANYCMSGEFINHGCHPFANLYEGNYGSNIRLDAVWGSAGYSTLFRNYMSRTGVDVTFSGMQDAIDLEEGNHYMNVVVNVLGPTNGTGSDGPLANCSTRNVNFRFGCSSPGGGSLTDADVSGTVTKLDNYTYVSDAVDTASGETLPDSYYLSGKPTWFGSIAYPPIGSDVSGYKNDIPAKVRHDTGSWPAAASSSAYRSSGGSVGIR